MRYNIEMNAKLLREISLNVGRLMHWIFVFVIYFKAVFVLFCFVSQSEHQYRECLVFAVEYSL